MNPTIPPLQKKYALTGKLRVGKDYVADKCGGKIFGFADPFYEIAERLFGKVPGNKDEIPGLRDFYQKLGQWGRGVVGPQYPLTPERAVFILLMRQHGPSLTDLPVDWASYGHTPDIWIHTVLARTYQETGEMLSDGYTDEGDPIPVDVSDRPVVFVSNCRFENEHKALTAAGFDHFHVLCSDQTYHERLRSAGISPDDPRLKDVSEQYARKFDAAVVKTLRTHETGPKLKVIWNDSRPIPSPRLLTVEEFKQYVKTHEQQTNKSIADYREAAHAEPKADSGEGAADVEAAPKKGSPRKSGNRNKGK